MVFLRSGVFGGLLSGAIWGTIWQTLLCIALIVGTGLSIKLEVAPGLIAGSVIGLFNVAHKPTNKKIYVIVGLLITTFLLVLCSFGRPFGSEFPISQWSTMICVLTLSSLIFFSVYLCVGPLTAGLTSKYLIEAFYSRLIWGLGLLFLILVVTIPFYVMTITSLKNQQSLLKNPLDLSIDISAGPEKLFNSYIELFVKYDFLTLLINSAFVSIVTVIITLLFSIPGAYAVAKLRFPAREWLSSSVLLIYLIPAIILVIPLYSVFSQLGLRNTLFGLCIVYPATTIPVALYMLKGYFSGLPSELDDAGLMDGLTRWQIILKISIPLSVPAIASVALYVFMIAWNEFLFAFMFLDDIKIFTLSRGIVSLDSTEVPRQHLMAAAVVATVPVLFIFLWFEKFLVSGLTSGSVKG